LIYLYADVADQVNLDITEDRLRRMLPMIERFQKAHPEAHVSATILFSGAVSQALYQRNAQTHIKDLILDYKKRGVIEVGYDGTDEPTYVHRPMYKLTEELAPPERWTTRAAADEKFLTEGRDPVTGNPLPGAVGGLKEMQQVFGEASCIRGASANQSVPPPPHPPALATATAKTPPFTVYPNHDVNPEVGDWELVPVLSRYNIKAILFGIPEVNPNDISGFKGLAYGIAGLMSPAANTAPELYWANDVLHTSEWSGGWSNFVRTLHGYEDVATLKDFAGKIDRSKVQIVHMELASEKNYLKPGFVEAWTAPTSSSPALAYAYAHPDSPKLPAEARLSADEVNAIYAKEDAALQWVAGDFFAANAGSRFVASSDFAHMTPPSYGYSISVAALQAAVKEMLAKWGNDTFPPIDLVVDGHYLSLAETFQVIDDALAEFDRTGKLPQSVKVAKVYGPVLLQKGHGPNEGELSVATIAKECSQIAASLHDETTDPIPHNSVPPGVVIANTGLTTAQFLRLMAEALVNPVPDAKLTIRMAYMATAVSQLYPKDRMLDDVGASWTFKPAPLEVGLHTTQVSH
jgi:hypothetical protein